MLEDDAFRALCRLLDGWSVQRDDVAEELCNLDWSDCAAVDDQIDRWIVSFFLMANSEDRGRMLAALEWLLAQDDDRLEAIVDRVDVCVESGSRRIALERIKARLEVRQTEPAPAPAGTGRSWTMMAWRPPSPAPPRIKPR